MVNIEEQLKYIYNLVYSNIHTKKYYDNLNKNTISLGIWYNNIININKLPNTLIKLSYWNFYYLYNLPLNLKILHNNKINCNLPPNIIYLYSEYYDIYNLPRSLQFIYIHYGYNKKNIIPKELIDHHFNKKNINFLDDYKMIIKLKSIY